MSFNESARFPLEIAFGAIGGPEYSTTIVEMNAGRESRNVSWSYPRAKFDVGTRTMRKTDTDSLIAFFHSVKGRAYGFRFRDWSDYQVSQTQGSLVAVTGMANTYQLVKSYASGSLTGARQIQKPVSVSIYADGVLLTTGYTVDMTTGIVTTSHGGVLTWSGEYDLPARFDTDTMQLDAVDKSNGEILFQWGQIPILETRE